MCVETSFYFFSLKINGNNIYYRKKNDGTQINTY